MPTLFSYRPRPCDSKLIYIEKSFLKKIDVPKEHSAFFILAVPGVAYACLLNASNSMGIIIWFLFASQEGGKSSTGKRNSSIDHNILLTIMSGIPPSSKELSCIASRCSNMGLKEEVKFLPINKTNLMWQTQAIGLRNQCNNSLDELLLFSSNLCLFSSEEVFQLRNSKGLQGTPSTVIHNLKISEIWVSIANSVMKRCDNCVYTFAIVAEVSVESLGFTFLHAPEVASLLWNLVSR